jgi:polysaccharide biosynthesis transport protein
MQTSGSSKPALPPPEEPNPHIKDYFKVVMARKWILISTFFVFVLSTTVFVFIKTPVYRATSRLEIQPASVDSKEMKAVYDATLSGIGGEFIRHAFLRTQYELILSNQVIAKTFAMEGYNLGRRPEFKELQDKEDVFREFFHVNPVPDTWLADVTFEWKDPIEAAAILEYLVANYLREYQSRGQKIDEATLDAKRNMLEALEGDVTTRYGDLQTYIDKENLVTLDDAPKAIRQHYDDLTKALKEAVLKVNETKSRHEDIRSALKEGRLEEMPEIIQNDTIKELKIELINAQFRLTELEPRFLKNHPEIMAAQRNLEFITQKIEIEKQCILSATRSEFDRARYAENELRGNLENEVAIIAGLNLKLGNYERLKKEYEDAKNNLSRLKSDIADLTISLAEKDKEKNIQVIDRARPPVKPIKPKKALSILIAGLAGLLIGLGLCFFTEYLDTTIKTKDDVEGALAIPVLGYVPPINFSAMADGQTKIELSALGKPHSLIAEAFRSIRTALMFSHVGRELKSILVTSPTPSEGKTLVSLNIAITLAQAGKKVLLVDADLRKPRLYKVFDLPLEPGLSNLLASGDSSMEQSFHSVGVENLSFLSSGPHPPNPAELLGSETMKGVVADLSGMFDHIIFDTPPTVNATDAATLAQFIGGVVLVVRSFKTERELAVRARDILRGAKVNLLGTILNNADVPKSGYTGYGNSYYYYYHPYYSYYSDDKTRTVRKRRRRKSSQETKENPGKKTEKVSNT